MFRQFEDKKGSTPWYVATADDVSDIVGHIEATPRIWGDSSTEEYPGANPWAGTRTMDEALKIARLGWPKGRDLLQKALDRSNVAMKATAYKSEGLDVAGNYPLVPAAVAGDPLSMVTRGLDSVRTKPAFRILVSISISWDIGPEIIIRRGGAILSWVDRLESMGFPVSIDVIETADGMGVKVTNQFCLKEAGQVLDVDRVAFGLAHPAVLRRLMFALQERLPLQGKWGGYGHVTNEVPKRLEESHSIYFPALMGGAEDWKSEASAVVAVEQAIVTALSQEQAFAEQIGGNES